MCVNERVRKSAIVSMSQIHIDISTQKIIVSFMPILNNWLYHQNYIAALMFSNDSKQPQNLVESPTTTTLRTQYKYIYECVERRL